jgi:hypothetical protein
MLGGLLPFVAVVELIPGQLEKIQAFQLLVFPATASFLAIYSLMTLTRKWNELCSLSP